ncbi:MAG: hypothetical protein V1659_02415 [Candidatus Woesearchaeota archaeon]
MRTYTYMVVAILIAFLLSFNTVKVFSLEEVSLFLTVIGLIYGLIAAFTINNAWERFSKIRDAIAEETSSLMVLYFIAKHLSDKANVKRLKDRLVEYCREVPELQWHEYWKSEKTHSKFRELFGIVCSLKTKTSKDANLYISIMEELRDADAARTQQLVLAQTRISKSQWFLNIFLSAILTLGVSFMQIPNYGLSIFIVTSMIACVIMLILVIYELDSMKAAENEVSEEPYRRVARIISEDSI